jgi:ABC-type antimicrobial peptide transport system permease subunit
MGSGALGHAQVVARSTGTPDRALAALQTVARTFDNRIAASELASYADLLKSSLATQRLMTFLLALFAVTTLTLGCVGVYGVASFSVRERFREIGVRMTLGADPSEIRNRVVVEGLWLALPGGILGLVLAAVGGRLLTSFLFGVSTLDPITFLAVPFVLSAAAVIAVYIPATRATRVDPATVLREE